MLYFATFLTLGSIFVKGTLFSFVHVDESVGSNCSRKDMTSFVIGVGVEAPAVTATVLASLI